MADPTAPPENGRIEIRGNGQVWIVPQKLIPDPTGLTPGKLVDDPTNPPYQQAAGTPAPIKLSPGQVAVDANGNVVASAPGKPAAPAKPISVAPGSTLVDANGNILFSAPPKPAAVSATAAGTNAKNTAAAGLDQARIDAMKQAAWSSVQPELDAIDQQFQAGTLTADQRDTAKAGVIDQAIKSTTTGMTASQRATAAYNEGALANTAHGQQVTQQGNAITEADSRANTAATILSNAQTAANDAAQHGSIVAGSVLNNTLAGAPGFLGTMGGGPMLTQDQKVQIGQALLNGATKQDVMPQLAQMHSQNVTTGPQFTAPGATPPGYGDGAPGTPGSVLSYGAGFGPADPNTPAWGPNSPGASAQLPQFAAPAAA